MFNRNPMPGSILADVLLDGRADWTSVRTFVSTARRHAGPITYLPELTIGVLAEALLGGFVVPGYVDDLFVPWDGNPANWLARIVFEMSQVDIEKIYTGDIAWFRNTSIGDAGASNPAPDVL
ncbi:MAG TPA: hypothetical protein PK819_05930 [Thermomicrobiales bacterium]|nr:hypothetical protein [Thermomicrobiales bacterium]